MPGPIIRPELVKLTSKNKDYLISSCNVQDDDIIMHYLQTGEIGFTDLSGLQGDRLARLRLLFEEWLRMPDPAETAAWDEICNAPDYQLADLNDLRTLLTKLKNFISKYPHSSHIDEAKAKIRDIKRRIAEIEHGPIWDQWSAICNMPEDNLSQMKLKAAKMEDFIRDNRPILDPDDNGFQNALSELRERIAVKELARIRYDFDSLLEAIRKFETDSALFKIADGYLWDLLKEELDKEMFKRFLKKVPESAHYDEAQEVLAYFPKWEPVRYSNDILTVWNFLKGDDSIPEPIREKAEDLMGSLKREEIRRMEENPSDYSRNRLMWLVSNDVIPLHDIINRGLLTEEAYEMVQNWKDFTENNPINVTYVNSNQLDQDDITDVYLFGVPSTGKTCVLMGLLGSDLYDWNNAIAAGEYGDILTLYRDNKMLPPRTLDEQFFSIHGEAKDRNGKTHLINVIELAGEQFLEKIAMNPEHELSLIDMDAYAAEHLKNKNRKIFFIVIDPTVKMIKYEKKIIKRDDKGNFIYDSDGKPSYDIKEMAAAQKTVIKKMMNILKNSENTEIMKKVDALHFIATKSDVIDHAKKDIRECVTDYQESFKVASELCKPKVANINEATGYKPKLYTFSLGKFYVGGAFEYDSTDSDKLMNVIIENTLAIRDYSSFETIVDKILNYKIF